MKGSMEQFWTFFAFPLNLILALLCAFFLYWLWKSRPECTLVRFLLSPSATISAVLLLLASCLWIGLTGDSGFVQSLFFVAALLYVQFVLFLIILRGWKPAGRPVRWRFLLVHAGLLLAMGAGFWGSPDSSESRVRLEKGQAVREAFRLDGRRDILAYELRLDDFKSEFSTDGRPVHYEAMVSVDGLESISITVNNPHSARLGEDIYLASVSESGCVFQIVREPWRYLAMAGIVMLLAGAFMLFVKGPVRR